VILGVRDGIVRLPILGSAVPEKEKAEADAC
jgi:hypothetical protein